MAVLTGKQCKMARLLLKWNLRELAYRSQIKPAVIDEFEKGNKQLDLSRRDALAKIFKKEGIELLDFGDVRLNEGARRMRGEAVAGRHSASPAGLVGQDDRSEPPPHGPADEPDVPNAQ